MTRANALKAILQVLTEQLGVPAEKLQTEQYDAPLTGSHFGLNGLKMTYLYLFLEQKLGVRIRLSPDRTQEFYTINKIANLLEQMS